MPSIEEVAETIRRLDALASNTPGPEAETARRIADGLRAQHRAALGARSIDVGADAIPIVSGHVDRGEWGMVLVRAIAEAYGCVVVFRRSAGGELAATLVGTTADRERAWADFSAHFGRISHEPRGTRWSGDRLNAWRVGTAVRVGLGLRGTMPDDERSVRERACERFVRRRFGRVRRERAVRIKDMQAFLRGIAWAAP